MKTEVFRAIERGRDVRDRLLFSAHTVTKASRFRSQGGGAPTNSGGYRVDLVVTDGRRRSGAQAGKPVLLRRRKLAVFRTGTDRSCAGS